MCNSWLLISGETSSSSVLRRSRFYLLPSRARCRLPPLGRDLIHEWGTSWTRDGRLRSRYIVHRMKDKSCSSTNMETYWSDRETCMMMCSKPFVLLIYVNAWSLDSLSAHVSSLNNNGNGWCFICGSEPPVSSLGRSSYKLIALSFYKGFKLLHVLPNIQSLTSSYVLWEPKFAPSISV